MSAPALPDGDPAGELDGEREAVPAPEVRRPELRIVERRRLLQRATRRRARVRIIIAVGILGLGGLAVAGGRALLASEQFRLDALDQQVASQVARDQNLQLERAQLSAPSRIMRVAEKRLGMVLPGSVTYLAPIDPGPTAAEAKKTRRQATARAASKGPRSAGGTAATRS